jgi:hypothetical protein
MSGWWWQQAVASPALLQTLLFLSAGHKAALESEKGVCILHTNSTKVHGGFYPAPNHGDQQLE